MNDGERMFSYQEMIEYGSRCVDAALKGMDKGALTVLGWTALAVGLFSIFVDGE